MRCNARLAAAFAVGGLAGCAVAPTPAPPPSAVCRPPANAQIEAELMFGLSLPGGGVVSQAQFDAFVGAEITPRFPAGLTILPGAGRWRTPEGRMLEEGARMVIIVAPDTTQTASRLRDIRRAYRMYYHQRSVGLITIGSCAAF